MFDQFGQQATDAFGNILGTTYQQNTDGSFIVDDEGSPIVDVPGNGITTDATGNALIKNLPPGKYGVRAVPRDGKPWIQTATIEGTPGIDTWIKANEPPYLVEFGAIFTHVFIGFALPTNDIATLPNNFAPAVGTLKGRVINVHQSKPPSVALQNGDAVPDAWIAINAPGAPNTAVYVAKCNADSTFQVDNLPPGEYQLVIWDTPLDQIVAFRLFRIPEDGSLTDLGDIPVNAWFGHLEGSVFRDSNQNGFKDPGEEPISSSTINLRFRDGSRYLTTTTGSDGSYGFNEVFPWFKWITVEVDARTKTNARYRATGLTAVVDDGGDIPEDNGWSLPSEGKRNPQIQADGKPYRTQLGPTTTQAMILYADQNHRIDWGRRPFGPKEKGSIAGFVSYDTTRAEDDPRYNFADAWQPGIPRVQVNLYADKDGDGVIDTKKKRKQIRRADVDNYPFGWRFNPALKGPEDVDWNGNGKFNQGDAIKIVNTTSWDDNNPTTACPGNPQTVSIGGVNFPIDACAETLRTWNQVRPGAYDGAYRFDKVKAGAYIVEVSPPPGYKVVKEEDKNVVFGESYIPSELLIPPVCVGDLHKVPKFLQLFPALKEESFYAKQKRPLCDRKSLAVGRGKNAAADFFLFTEVSKSGRIIGLVTNDLANTFNPNDPNSAEKLSPPFVPISIQDYMGKEVVRTYSDQHGGYNALVPSNFTAAVPQPTGLALNMVTICLNDPDQTCSLRILSSTRRMAPSATT